MLLQTRLDSLFFELSVKAGPGSQRELAKFEGSLRQVGVSSGLAAVSLEDFAKETRRTDRASKKTTGTLGRFFGAFKAGAGTITAVATTFLALDRAFSLISRGVRSIVGGFANLAKRGGEVINVSRAFTGVVGDQEAALGELRAASRGLISDFELIVNFNRAVALGSATNTEEFAKLTETALTLGRALGVDAAFALESLNLGIGRQSRLILDNLGLIISLEQANRDFAQSIGKNVDQLSAQEKRLAFNTAAFAAAEEKIATLGGVVENNADNFRRLGVVLENARNRLAVLIADSPVVADAIELLTAAVTKVIDAFQSFIGLEAPSDAPILNFIQELLSGIRLLPAEFDLLVARVTVAAATIRAAFARAFGGIIDDNRDLIIRLGNRFIEFSDNILNRFNPAIQAAAAGTAQFLETLGENAALDESFAKSAEDRLQAAKGELEIAETIRDLAAERIIAARELREEQARARREVAGRADPEAARRLKEQTALLIQLEDAVAETVQTAARQTLATVEQLGVDLAIAFEGNIPEAAQREFDKLLAIARDALSQEEGERLGKELAEGITRGLEEIELAPLQAQAVVGARAPEVDVQRQQLAFLQEQERVLRSRLATEKLSDAQQRAILKTLQQIRKEQEKITKEQETQVGDTEKALLEAAKERFQAQQAIVSLISQAAQGALDLANNFGIVSDEVAGTLSEILKIGQGIATVINSVQALQAGFGSLFGIISGGIGVLGALGGIIAAAGGPTEEQAAAIQAQEQNLKALRDLTRSVDELKGSFDIAGADFANALRDLTVSGGEIDLLIQQIQELEELGGPAAEIAANLRREFERILRDMGIDIANLDEVAEELGITIRDEAGNIIPEALQTLVEALQAVEDQIVGFADTIAGAFARFRAEIELFDITDPIEQFALLQRRLLDIQGIDAQEAFRILNDQTLTLLERIGKLQEAFERAGRQVTPFLAELLAIDISTAEGREQAQNLIESLARQLFEGTLLPEDLGAATFEEAVQILLEMEGLLDDIADNTEGTGEDLEGQTQDVRKNIQITELQGNQLLALESTQAELLRLIRDDVNAILQVVGGAFEAPIQPPIVPLTDGGRLLGPPDEIISPDGGGVTIGRVEINAEINVGAGATREQAQEAREELVDLIADDLGQRIVDRNRLRGLPEIRRQR